MSNSYNNESEFVKKDYFCVFPNDNEFFVQRAMGNDEILRRNFIIARPEVYNIEPPQNTQLVRKNVRGRLMKYDGIDGRSKKYWTRYLNDKNKDGLPLNYDIDYTQNGENSLSYDPMPHIAGTNINIKNENSLRGLGRLNKLDATRRPDLIGLENVMGTMDMYDTYFSVSNNLDNAPLFIGNPTRAINITPAPQPNC